MNIITPRKGRVISNKTKRIIKERKSSIFLKKAKRILRRLKRFLIRKKFKKTKKIRYNKKGKPIIKFKAKPKKKKEKFFQKL